MELKVGQKIWHIVINNGLEEASYRKNGVNITELAILGISKHKICLNDEWFRRLDIRNPNFKKKSYETYLDDITVAIRVGGNILGDGVFIYLFSSTKPTKRMLKKMATAAGRKISKDYGFLMAGAEQQLHEFANNYKF